MQHTVAQYGSSRLSRAPAHWMKASRRTGRPSEGQQGRAVALPGVVSGGILAFTRGLGEFGATAMIAGNIAGVTRTLPIAVYSAVSAGDEDVASGYVVILIIISFAAIVCMNYLTARKYKTR